jgi:4-amino-4-deoxy-L-arabinose transferase-like glycosyltransferase
MDRSRWLETVNAHRGLLLVLAVALIVRLTLAVVIQNRVDQPPQRLCLIPGDAEGYWELAQNIRAGRDFAIYEPPRHVLRTPGFPILLAVSQSIFGESPFAARCLLAIVGGLACGLTYWLGTELTDKTTAFLAAIYTALSPTLALFSVLLLSETTFAASLLVSLIAIRRMTERIPNPSATISIRVAFVAGLLIGVATMIRPTWLYVGLLIGAVVIVLGAGKGAWRRRGLQGAFLVGGIVVSLAPWTIRNFYVTGHLVPTTLWVGPSLYDGLNPAATGDSDMQFIEDDQLTQRLSEYEVDREYRRRAWDFAFHNPVRTAWLAMKKQQRYWSLVPNADQFRDWKLQVVVCLTGLPLLVFGGLGLWKSRHDKGLLVLTTGPILLFAGLHLLFVGSLRYRLPAEYPFSILAAVGVRELLTRCKLLPVASP